MPKSQSLFLVMLLALLFTACEQKIKSPAAVLVKTQDSLHLKKYDSIYMTDNVTVDQYFSFMDSVVKAWDSTTNFALTEHLLVRNNPWIIDTLANTDYYRQIARDSFIYDQKQMIVLPKESRLVVPDSIRAQELLTVFKNTYLDLNIPEFKLRVFQDSALAFEFPVRVGRYEKKYLEMSGRVEDLRTKSGKGEIVSYNCNPRYVNPCNNKEYHFTRRDDDSLTKLPRIPFIATQINGVCNGQMIHPTTNPKTLGKAYSNGCIGTREADAWIIYYHAPIGTPIHIRYELNVTNKNGDSLILKDIYRRNRSR